MGSINQFFVDLQLAISSRGAVHCHVHARSGGSTWESAQIIGADDPQDKVLIKHKDGSQEWYPRVSPLWQLLDGWRTGENVR